MTRNNHFKIITSMTVSEDSCCTNELLWLLPHETRFTIEAAFPYQINVKAFLKKAYTKWLNMIKVVFQQGFLIFYVHFHVIQE